MGGLQALRSRPRSVSLGKPDISPLRNQNATQLIREQAQRALAILLYSLSLCSQCHKTDRMRSSAIRHCLIAITFAASAVLPSAGRAQQPAYPAVLGWEELAAHAGLVGVKPKTAAQFRVDVHFLLAKKISALKAAIFLSGEEWVYISSNNSNHLLHPWFTNRMDGETWKSTVDLILPNEQTTVKVDRLKLTDPAVIIRRPDMQDVRVYILSANPDGKSGMLYYFYHHFGS